MKKLIINIDIAKSAVSNTLTTIIWVMFGRFVLLKKELKAFFMAIISGPIYALMISKAPKIGTQVLFFGLKGLYMLLMGQVLTGVIFIIGGIICELIVMGDGYRRIAQSGTAYALHMTLYGLGSFFPVLFFADNYAKQLT